jgi:hypothetical protein
LETADRLAQVFKTYTVVSRRRADQFAGHRGDLAAFGFTIGDRDGAARKVDTRWHRHDATVLAAR